MSSTAYFNPEAFERAFQLLPAERDLLFWTTFRDTLLAPLNTLHPSGRGSAGTASSALALYGESAAADTAPASPVPPSSASSPTRRRLQGRWTSAVHVHARDAPCTYTEPFLRAFALVRSINAAEVAEALRYPLAKVVPQLLLGSRYGMLHMWFTRPCLQCGSFTRQQSSSISGLMEMAAVDAVDGSPQAELLAPCSFCGEPKFSPTSLSEIQCLFTFQSGIFHTSLQPGLSNRCLFSPEALRRRLTRVFVPADSSLVLSVDLPHGTYTVVCEEQNVLATLKVAQNKNYSMHKERMARSEAVLSLDGNARDTLLVADSYVDVLFDNPSPVACFVSLHAAFDPRVECGGVNPPRFFSTAELLFSSSVERFVFSALEPFKSFQLPRNVVMCQWSIVSNSIAAQIAVTCVLLTACEQQHGAVVGGSTGQGTIRVIFWRACNAMATAAVVAQALARDSKLAGDVAVTATLVEQAPEPAASGLVCGSLLYHAPREFQLDVFGPVSKRCAMLHRRAEDAVELQLQSAATTASATATTTSTSTASPARGCDLVRLALYSFGDDNDILPFSNAANDTMFDKVLTMIVDMTDAKAETLRGTAAVSALVWPFASRQKLAAAPVVSDMMVPAFYEDDGNETNSFAEM